MILLILARFIGLIPEPQTRDKDELILLGLTKRRSSN
jgi:hypothetical protein